VTDLFTTLAGVAGAQRPNDRPIDGVDQSEFLFRNATKSAREGFPFYIKGDLRAVKWRDWKLHYYWEPQVNEGKGKLESPYLFNLTRDPKEETDVFIYNTWVLGPILKLVREFQLSFKDHPNIPPGQSESE
jgi:arylsulfatase